MRMCSSYAQIGNKIIENASLQGNKKRNEKKNEKQTESPQQQPARHMLKLTHHRINTSMWHK